MILVWLLKPLVLAARWIIEQMPVFDATSILSYLGPLPRLIGWVAKLNEGLPVVEGLLGFGLVFGVWFAMYGVALIRRTFSLFWPGAGS